MSYLSSLWKKAVGNPIFPWIVVFLIINITVTERGGENASARFATLRAIVNNQTFEITPYRTWTIDWAQTPDKKYYSNKLPGPVFVGLPLFYLIDKVSSQFSKKNRDEKEATGYYHKMLLSIIMQAIPFAILLLVLTYFYNKNRIEPSSLHFLALSLLFGNTSSMFMNSYFGHGMAALFLLAFYFFYENKKFCSSSFFLGMAMLTDFSACVFAACFGIYLLIKERFLSKKLILFLVGGLIPGILWCWYHISCYGSPFLTANSFPNPSFLDNSGSSIFYKYPQVSIFLELLFGSKRGILFTMPWIIFLIFYTHFISFKNNVYKQMTKEFKEFIIVVCISFWALLLINSTFSGWHSGGSPGARYFSAILPFWGLIGYKLYPYFTKLERIVLWVGLLISLVFRGQVLATTILMPTVNMWFWQWNEIITHRSLTPWVRLVLFWGSMVWAYRKIKKSGQVSSFHVPR